MSFMNEFSLLIKENKNEDLKNYITMNSVDINEVSSIYQLPLNIAIRYSNISAMQVLLEEGALLDIEDSDGLSPIENAAWCNDKKVIDFILENAEHLSVFHLENALRIAIAKGNTNASACLIKHGVEVNQLSLNRLLYISSIRGENDNVKVFYFNGAKLNSNNDGINPITGAIRNKNMDTVKILIEIGGEDVGYESPLQNVNREEWFSYVYNNELDMIRHTIARCGSDIVKANNKDGQDALTISVINNDLEQIKLLSKFYDKNKDKEKLEKIISMNDNPLLKPILG